MKRIFRHLFRPMAPAIQESPEEREKRETLEFFYSLPLSEQLRLAIWFHDLIETGEVGRHEFTVEQAAAATV